MVAWLFGRLFMYSMNRPEGGARAGLACRSAQVVERMPTRRAQRPRRGPDRYQRIVHLQDFPNKLRKVACQVAPLLIRPDRRRIAHKKQVMVRAIRFLAAGRVADQRVMLSMAGVCSTSIPDLQSFITVFTTW
jgi:hypothetical protein